MANDLYNKGVLIVLWLLLIVDTTGIGASLMLGNSCIFDGNS